MRRTFIPSLLLLLLGTVPAFAGWEEGVAAFNAGRYDDAESEFRTFIERSPQAADAYYMLGLTLQRQKRTDEAIAALGRAAELSGDPQHRLALSQALIKAGRGDDALESLAAQDPKALPQELRQPYNLLLSTAASMSSRPDAAFAALDRALAAAPEAKHLQAARAEVARKAGRLGAQIDALVAAFDIDPSDTGLLSQAFGVAMRAAGNDGDQAAQWYRTAYDVARRWAEAVPSAETYIAAGEALMGAQSYPEARGWFEKAEAKAGTADAKLLYYIGSCYLAEEQPQDALGRLEKALVEVKGPELRQTILLSKGSALRHLEEFRKAADVYRQAGDTDKVAEMIQLAAAQDENIKWEQARQECLRKKKVIEETRASTAELRGTPEWEAAEAEFSEVLAACEPYLREES